MDSSAFVETGGGESGSSALGGVTGAGRGAASALVMIAGECCALLSETVSTLKPAADPATKAASPPTKRNAFNRSIVGDLQGNPNRDQESGRASPSVGLLPAIHPGRRAPASEHANGIDRAAGAS